MVPPHIEGLLVADECIDQAVVCGEGRHYLTALLVPHWDNLRKALGGSVSAGTEDALARDPAVCEFLGKRVDACTADLAGYEKVKKFIVRARPFTVAEDELTVSLKTRRNVIFAKHQTELDALYRDHP